MSDKTKSTGDTFRVSANIKVHRRMVEMKKKKIVIALGHEALGTTLPEQKEATKRTAKAVADLSVKIIRL